MQKFPLIFYLMNQKSYLILILVSICACQQKPPVFPSQYELGFNESASIGPLSGNTTGKMYVDADNNRELITRQNGHHDRYCGSVYKFSDTRCNHYVVNGKPMH